MDLGVVQGGIYLLKSWEDPPRKTSKEIHIISIKSVFSHKIDCLAGSLVNIGALGALKGVKNRPQGNLDLFLSIFKTCCNFLIFWIQNDVQNGPNLG
jgi:hypothetical protein